MPGVLTRLGWCCTCCGEGGAEGPPLDRLSEMSFASRSKSISSPLLLPLSLSLPLEDAVLPDSDPELDSSSSSSSPLEPLEDDESACVVLSRLLACCCC